MRHDIARRLFTVCVVLAFAAACTPRTPPIAPTAAEPSPPSDTNPAPRTTEGAAPPLAPATIPEAERLQPCRVELEHRYLDEDDETWVTRRIGVARFVRDWERQRGEVDWMTNPIAPIPLSRDQAMALLPGAEAQEAGEDRWVSAESGESSFSYVFDDQGRTTQVDWDPVADSSVYLFHYSYECDPGDLAPAWTD